MNKPLDLDAIRERINHPLNNLMVLSEAGQAERQWNVASIKALISEVEALRGIIRQTKKCVECNELMEPLAANPELWNEDIHIVCVGKLRDKLNEALNKLKKPLNEKQIKSSKLRRKIHL